MLLVILRLAHSYCLTAWRTLLGPTTILVVFLLTHSQAFAGQTTLAWDGNTNPDISGYMLYYGQSSGSYTSQVDVGKAFNFTVTDLPVG
jgi:hypothetical protein